MGKFDTMRLSYIAKATSVQNVILKVPGMGYMIVLQEGMSFLDPGEIFNPVPNDVTRWGTGLRTQCCDLE